MSDTVTVTTDQSDYQPGDTAVIIATNVTEGATVEFSVAKVYAVLGKEQRIVTLLRYFGSAVQEEEAFS